jgi:hypothetical protein
MADPNRLGGVASVTIDGRTFSIVGEGTYRPSSSKRESLVGQDGYHGYSEMPQPGKISWKGRDSGAVNIGALNEAANVTVVLVLANGKTVVGRNMARTGEPIEVNSEDATFSVEFEGADVRET